MTLPQPDKTAPAMPKNQLALAGQVLRFAGHALLDRIRKPRPRDLGTVPHAVDMLTPEWLTAALCQHAPGAAVEHFETSRASHGSTVRAAIRVDYNAAGQAAKLPARLFAKSTPGFTTRVTVGMMGGLTCEQAFYMKVRSELDIETPPGLYFAYDPPAARSLFLFEDIATTRGAEFLNTEAVINRAQAENMARLLARLHGRFWNSPRLETEFSWLRTSSEFFQDITKLIGFEKRSLVGFDRGLHIMPASLRTRRSEIWPAVIRSLEMNSAQPRTYLHHDVHIGNWYRTADGHMGLTDWQLNVKGQWASDFAYAFSSALKIEDRRAWERDLLSLYLQELANSGAPAPSFADAWLQYRQQQFHGYAFWLYTLGHGPLQPKMQPDSYSLANLERMGAAIEDLNSLDSLT